MLHVPSILPREAEPPKCKRAKDLRPLNSLAFPGFFRYFFALRAGSSLAIFPRHRRASTSPRQYNSVTQHGSACHGPTREEEADAGSLPHLPRSGWSFSVAVLLLFCAACASPPPPQLNPLPPQPDPKTQVPALETRIFDLIQDARRTIDPQAKKLVPDAELARVARQHSQDMADKNYLAHAGPDGQSSASLVMDEDKQFEGLLGENIAAQYYMPASGMNVEAFAQRFVKTWLASPAHRANLSFPAYDRSGVGAAVNGNTVYVTQLFATDLGLTPAADSKTRTVTGLDLPGTGVVQPKPDPQPSRP